MSVIVCTICSREKDKGERLMPAYERYKGDHIQNVRMIAQAAHKAYYILSGKFGLLKAGEPVPPYDYALRDKEAVKKLSYLISSRLSQDNVTHVVLYTKVKGTWAPYTRAMGLACQRCSINLRIVSL